MGDQAVNIAEQAMVVNQQAPIKPYQDLPRMAEVSSEMVRRGLHAFMTRDVEEAKQVLEMDDAVDQLKDKIYEDVQQLMESNPAVIRMGVSLIMIAHNLERIGDLATNIAEDVIYLNRGIDVRHHIRERRTD